MAARGYAGTSISSICREAGLPAPSIYWHFESKAGLLAAVMERGARRWFATLPRWDDVAGTPDERIQQLTAAGARALTAHPAFLRLFYLLVFDSSGDAQVGEIVQRVRARAFEYVHETIARLLEPEHGADVSHAAADELARFGVAVSDGLFFALQLEPAETDAEHAYGQLITAVRALAPAAVARVKADT